MITESSDDSMCSNYEELGEEWRSTEYSATVDKSDHTMASGWLVGKTLLYNYLHFYV